MIALACRNLSGIVGGVERMLTNLANQLSSNGHEVIIVSWDISTDPSFYKLNENIIWKKVGLSDPRKKSTTLVRLRRIKMLREIIKTYKIRHFLCFQLGVYNSIVLASFYSNTRVYALERNSLQRFSYTTSESKYLNYLFLLFSSKIVVQFDSYKKDYPFFLRKKILSIPNFHNNNFNLNLTKLNNTKKVVFAGRFSFQKNIFFTLDLFIECCKISNNINFEFIGTGGAKSEMIEIINNSGFSQRIKFVEPKQNWFEDKDIDALCLFSLWEGFPNVILEAFSNSILCIGAIETKGINDLLSENRGFLLKTESPKITARSLIEKLSTTNQHEKIILSNAFRYSEKLNASKVIPMWEKLINEQKN